uniref:Uncharacterized protein n=1 Tax=Sinocyclocheilus grahami TaxID=75366 RepID=A0A672L6P8_SINGR
MTISFLSCVVVAARNVSASTNLKDVLADLIPKEQSRIKNFRQQHGKTTVGQITVDMCCCSHGRCFS